MDLSRPNAKFQTFEALEAQQYQLGFDDLVFSYSPGPGEEIQIATLSATVDGVSTEPIQITLANPKLEPIVSHKVEAFDENYHLYSSLVFDKSTNKNWYPFQVDKSDSASHPVAQNRPTICRTFH